MRCMPAQVFVTLPSTPWRTTWRRRDHAAGAEGTCRSEASAETWAKAALVGRGGLRGGGLRGVRLRPGGDRRRAHCGRSAWVVADPCRTELAPLDRADRQLVAEPAPPAVVRG